METLTKQERDRLKELRKQVQAITTETTELFYKLYGAEPLLEGETFNRFELRFLDELVGAGANLSSAIHTVWDVADKFDKSGPGGLA